MSEPVENGEPNHWPAGEPADPPLEPLSLTLLEEEVLPQACR